jgi:hydrogenase-4 component E
MRPELVALVLGAVLILDVRTIRVVAAYAVLAAWVAWLALPTALASPFALALFGASFCMKLILAPVGMWLFTRRNPAARDLRPALNLPARLILVLALALVAVDVVRVHALVPFALVEAATFVVLCGLTILVVHRNLLAAIVGLLVIGTGVTLTAAALAPGLPESIELGAAFDALIATFIGLALVRAFLAHNPLLDVASLRSLRG